MADWIGRTIGKVHIESLIARGGMAEVYLGYHSTLHRQVAIKVLRGQLDKDSDAMARFQREAQVVSSLRHPNIIQMLDQDFVDEQPYLVMEYIPGPTLASYLKELHKHGEKLPLETTSRIIASLAQALDYAHNQGLVHRDIKPANVLLRSPTTQVDINEPLPTDVEPILTDFGLVRHLESSLHTSTGTVTGTPTYMSPEQARGDKVDIRTDIYSLGIMFYEMLSGSVPFESDSTFGVLLKHINEAPPPINGISTDLQAVIDRAMAKDSALRYAHASEMASDFHSIFNGETISPKTLTMAKLSRESNLKKNQRMGFGTWGWVALGLILIAVFTVGFMLRKPSQTNQTPVTLQPTATPIGDTNPVGKVSFGDFKTEADKTILTLNLEPPPAGKHYEAWYLAEGGEVRKNVGKVDFSSGLDQGQLTFIDPEQKNVLGLYDHVEISLEPDNDPAPDQPAEIMYSSIFPPRALIHVRHVLYMFDPAPDQKALIQGVRITADNINIAAGEIQAAFEAKNKALLRKKTEELVNQLVGEQNADFYKDWDADGVVDDPGDKYGLMANGGIAYDTGQQISQGYIAQAISHAQYAAQAPDATSNIISQSESVVICLNNMEGWGEQLVQKAIELNNTPFGADMTPLIAEINQLSQYIVHGVDSNGNKLIESNAGEGGADTAYEDAYKMADMPILNGLDQVPPPDSAQNSQP